MKNKAYYFSHDGNAHNDVKIQYLISDLGMEGYGIFWFTIEKLFDAGGILPLKIIKILASQMNVSEAKVQTIIRNYELFTIVDELFYSQRLMRHFEAKKILSESGKRGAKIKWGGYSLPINPPNSPPISPPNGEAIDTPIARKEKKRKEKKEGEWNTTPTPSDVGSLPEAKIKAAIDRIKYTIEVDIGADKITGLYEVFKKENLTGKKYYPNEEEVQQHFSNWLKFQQLEKNAKSKIRPRDEGVIEFLEIAKRDYEHYQNEQARLDTTLPIGLPPNTGAE